VTVNTVLLITLAAAAVWTVMTRSLLRSAIGLAFTSAILTVVMFRLNSPLAAVFELSVCTGLISVLFISTISLTHPLNRKEVLRHMKDRLRRFGLLPLLIVAVGLALIFMPVDVSLRLPQAQGETDPRVVLWSLRRLDLLGQIIILLAGVFGVVILLRESKNAR
jgi:NADH-quinone oxidoreductase subunit J